MDIFNLKKIKGLEQQVKALMQKQMLQTPLTLNKGVNNAVAVYPEYTIANNANEYVSNDNIYSIIKLLVTTALSVPSYLYNVNDKGGKGDVNIDNELNGLLAEPNDEEDNKIFLEKIITDYYLHGEAFILLMKPNVGVNEGKAKAMYHLMPQGVILNMTDNFTKVVSYDYIINGRKYLENIPKENIIHIKTFNPSFNSMGRGVSPLKVLLKRIERVKSNFDAATAQLQNGGVPGIVYEKGNYDNTFASEIIGQRKQNFYNYLVDRNNVGAPYFSVGDMGYIQLGLKLADLETLNLESADFKKICNAYSIDSKLFNDVDGLKYDNYNIAMKRLYTMTILPCIRAINSALQRQLIDKENKGSKLLLIEDISEITELQEDMQYMANVYSSLPIMIPYVILDSFKIPYEDNEEIRKVYIKQGYMPLEDMNINVGDISNTNE
jgi:HK97 family phage portal protein